jgi:hypothetical protein
MIINKKVGCLCEDSRLLLKIATDTEGGIFNSFMNSQSCFLLFIYFKTGSGSSQHTHTC